MNRVETSQSPWTPSFGTRGNRPSGVRRHDGLRGPIQIVASWAVLASIGLVYVLQAGTALSAPPTPGIDLESSWADVSRDARAVRLEVSSFSSSNLALEAIERIRSDVILLSDRLSDLVGDLPPAAGTTVEPDLVRRVEVHRSTLLRLFEVRAETETAALTATLDALIDDADVVAAVEREIATARLEEGSLLAIRTLGARLLSLAVTGVIVALVLTGLGDGMSMLSRSRMSSLR